MVQKFDLKQKKSSDKDMNIIGRRYNTFIEKKLKEKRLNTWFVYLLQV
jgi:hypothetical protein